MLTIFSYVSGPSVCLLTTFTLNGFWDKGRACRFAESLKRPLLTFFSSVPRIQNFFLVVSCSGPGSMSIQPWPTPVKLTYNRKCSYTYATSLCRTFREKERTVPLSLMQKVNYLVICFNIKFKKIQVATGTRGKEAREYKYGQWFTDNLIIQEWPKTPKATPVKAISEAKRIFRMYHH